MGKVKKQTVSIEVESDLPLKELEKKDNWVFRPTEKYQDRQLQIKQIRAFVVQEPSH